ncbi:MAG: outer membrane beta-barrel protein [Muribaculaceae bacterium]|nr:outer membrane beta-barrel protein [Muribaculaceae bacterium]
MRRLILLLFSAVLLHVPSFAREIKGIVLSARDSLAVSGAECRLLQGDSKFITGVTTGTDGFFRLNTDWREKATLTVSFPGYEKTTIHIDKGNDTLDVGTVYLDDATTLEEVTVTAGSIIHSKGRMILYPDASDVKASATTLSLFQKLLLPGLEANPINRSLSVDGGSPVILINGIPSSLDDFNSLQPKDIEKIEYSRSAPIRYADKGSSGYINITLKKRNDGGDVYLWGRSAVNTAFVDANLRVSYHQGPSQFALTYNPSWRNYHKVFDDISESYIGDDFRVDIESHDRNPFWYVMQGIQLRYNYSPSLKTLFSASFNARPYSTKRTTSGEATDSELGDYTIDNYSKSNEFTPSLDLFLRHDFNDIDFLEVQVVGTLSSDNYTRDNRYLSSAGLDDSYLVSAETRRRSLISEISYIHDFTPTLEFSTGYQNTISHSSNKYKTTDYEPVLTENNNYVYAGLGWSIKKVYLSLNTGLKLYWLNNDDNKRHFIRNLSRFYFSWSISQKWNISGSARYSSGIPSLSSLTDYAQQVSPYLINNGNSNLKSTEYYNLQLQTTYSYKKVAASLYATYNLSDNFVMTDVRYIGNGLFLSQSVNAKSSWDCSAGLNIRINNIAGFGANLRIGISRYETRVEDWKADLTSLSGDITLWWNKGPFTISYWRSFPGKYLSGYNVGKSENGDGLQFDYRPDKHWNIGASWTYMFNKKGTQYPSWNSSPVNPRTVDRYIKNNSNMVLLSVTYTADFGSIFRTARRNLNNSDKESSLLKM